MTQKEKETIIDIYATLAENFQWMADYIDDNVQIDNIDTFEDSVEKIKEAIETQLRVVDLKLKLNTECWKKNLLNGQIVL